MPGYIERALSKFQHSKPSQPHYAPHRWNVPIYAQQMQYAPSLDTTKPLDKKEQHMVQSIVGTFLYYRRAVETPILVALNDIATQQVSPMEKTLQHTDMLLDYMWTYLKTRLPFFAKTCNCWWTQV